MKTFSKWLEDLQEKIPKVLWITGMGSTGEPPRQLAQLGYDVKAIGTTTNRYAAYLGRFKRYQPLSSILGHSGGPIVRSHLKTNVEKHDDEMMESDFIPDIVVGTSQGGAIAMQVAKRYPNAKFVLGAPAWKIFGANPSNLPEDTIIIHGSQDIIVPVADSKELANKYGFELRVFNFKHQIPIQYIRTAIDDQLAKLGEFKAHLILTR